MKTHDFFGKINNVASLLQSQAYDLTRDMDEARALYIETVYHAKKNSNNFNQGISFKDWILSIMMMVFRGVSPSS